MEICKEMIKLRKGLDERGIVWIDASGTEINSVAVADSLLFDIDCSIDEILEVIDGLKVR